MSQGRESPDPQRQTGTQLHNHPGQGLHSENKTKGQVEESSKSQLGKVLCGPSMDMFRLGGRASRCRTVHCHRNLGFIRRALCTFQRTQLLYFRILYYGTPSPAAVDQHARICGIGFDADAVLTRGQPAYNASVDVVQPQFVRKLVIRGSNTYPTQPVAAKKAVLWASLEAAKARIFRRW